MPQLAETVRTTPYSGIREMAELARRIPDALHLEVGDPNFDTPAHIIEAAAQAATEGFTKYTPSGGLLSLRELIVEKVRARNAIDCSVEQVVVTTGGCGALYTSLLTLLDPGDEVLIPDPGWANYPPMIHVQTATPVGYPLDPARDFEPDLEKLEASIRRNTKAILVNSPGNPTGAVYGPETLGVLLEIAERHDLWVISDECYDEIVFDGSHVSMASLDPTERLITVFSFSKSYAMTGWRVGYVVASTEVADRIAKAQEPVQGNASSVSQKGAEAALTGDQACVAEMRNAYCERRDRVGALLDGNGVGYVRARGAFYVMVGVSPSASLPFAKELLETEHVCVVPGSAFGPHGEGMVRVSLSVDPDVLMEGLARLSRVLRED